jgi:transposase
MVNDFRKLDQKSQEKIRIQAVRMIRRGKTHLEVSEFLGIKRQVVSKWWSLFKKSGISGLKMRSRANKSESSKVKWKQAVAVRKIILNKTPDQLNFSFMLWTRDAVRLTLKKLYGISLGLSAVGRLLRKLGLTPQKPMKKAYQQSSEKVRTWLKVEYPKIQAYAKKIRAEIQWGDEMGIRSDDQIGRTYGKRGQTPVIEITGNRFRTNMISSISNRGKLRFMVFGARFTTDVFLEFLKRLIKDATNKTILILDGHPVHKSKRAKAWFSENSTKIELFLLPAYSPELNPDEYLNQDIKQNTRKQRPQNQKEMETNLRSFLKSKQKSPSKIKKYFLQGCQSVECRKSRFGGYFT